MTNLKMSFKVLQFYERFSRSTSEQQYYIQVPDNISPLLIKLSYSNHKLIITTAEIGHHSAAYWTPIVCNEMIMEDTEQEHQHKTTE